MSKTILILAIAAAFVTGTITTTTLVFAHGGDLGFIHACVNKVNGQTRIVGASDTCKNNENPLHWGITGPAGPPGPEGTPGLFGNKVYLKTVEVTTDSLDFKNYLVNCETEDIALSGTTFDDNTRFDVFISQPSVDPNSWTYGVDPIRSPTTFPADIKCLDITP